MTNCPACGAALPPSAISESLGAGRCPSCRALVDLGPPRAQAPAAALATPEKWEVDAQPGALTIRWRWFGLVALGLVPFALFWNGILLAFAAGGTEGFQHPERLLVGLALPHVWIGVGLAYYCVALFLNSTTVRLAEGQLTVRHGPLWWPSKRDLPSRDVQQLFVIERIGNKGSRRYELCALLRDGKRVTVLKPDDEQQARYLEARLEQALNLVDQRVVGEHRP